MVDSRLQVAKMSSRQGFVDRMWQQSGSFKELPDKDDEVTQFFMQYPPEKCRNTEVKTKAAKILAADVFYPEIIGDNMQGRNFRSMVQDDTANATLEKTHHARAK